MHPAFLRSQHRLVNVPAEGDYTNHLKYGKFEETQDSGKYIVVFANCNEEGRAVIVQGHTVWKSLHGYLPGDKFGLMYFYGFLFLTYFVILVWYGVSMKMFEDANIPIQSWIFATISMGTLELFFLAGDLFVWNEDGTRFWVAYYVGKSWQTQRYQARKSHF
jgi:Lung seven transmembrane receptor